MWKDNHSTFFLFVFFSFSSILRFSNPKRERKKRERERRRNSKRVKIMWRGTLHFEMITLRNPFTPVLSFFPPFFDSQIRKKRKRKREEKKREEKKFTVPLSRKDSFPRCFFSILKSVNEKREIERKREREKEKMIR